MRTTDQQVAAQEDARPPWAIDPFNPQEDGGRCPTCGAYWEVVRPGKWQPHCECYIAADPQATARCTSCDDTGMVHRADGEYVGDCPHCAADNSPKVLP